MSVRELRNQEAEHDSGVVLRNLDRFTVQVEYRQRTLDLFVERSPGDYTIYLPARPVWDDGSPIPTETMQLIRDAVAEIEAFWGARTTFRRQS